MMSNFTLRLAGTLAMLTVLLAGCSASAPSRTASAAAPTASAAAPTASTESGPLTLAEMRMDAAGGPSRPAIPAGIASPVTSSGPAANALTDAGPNTPLGKQWIFASANGFDGPMPQSPRNASLLLSRESGRMIGNTMCNSMSAAFDISMVQATLRFRNLSSTHAMCGEPNRSVESAVLDALTACDSFLLDGKRLKLFSKGQTVAELTTP
ncbi:MAG TPA: META domain-containing protein [Candidatus Limnocylindrales bacterium]|nr:META domain-containing protein [Candidatus Limnocylindrales bacterium]